MEWDAGLYDGRHGFVWREAEALLAWLTPRAGERVLDLGCGTGHLTARIAATGAEVVGLDPSAAMLGRARREHPGLTFVEGDARDFDLGVFDAVFSNAVLHWVRPPEDAARCVARALKPGGRFVAEFGGSGNIVAICAAVRRAAEEAGVAPPLPDWYFPTATEYSGVLEVAGLRVVRAELFARPTALEGEAGLRGWLRQFAPEAEALSGRVEELARAELWREGRWVADYVRLRVEARR